MEIERRLDRWLPEWQTFDEETRKLAQSLAEEVFIYLKPIIKAHLPPYPHAEVPMYEEIFVRVPTHATLVWDWLIIVNKWLRIEELLWQLAWVLKKFKMTPDLADSLQTKFGFNSEWFPLKSP